MRVLMMAHLFSPFHNAGAEVMAHSLLESLAQAGHDVDVLCSRRHPNVSGAYSVDGITVYPPLWPKADPFAWFASDDYRPDVVVTHLESTHRAAVLSRRFRVPHVVLMHNDYLQSRELLRICQPELAVYNTEWMRTRCEAWWVTRVSPSPPASMVVRPPVDRQRYATAPGEDITLVNLTEDKGSRVFYELAQRLPRKQFLGVAGAYGEQDIRPRDNVTVLTHMAPLAMVSQVYRRTRVLLMPSVYESYGRVGAEPLCSGIPVIAHPTEGLHEALGESCVFVDRDDLDGWEKAVRKLLTTRAWQAASKRALRQAERLDPAKELKAWVRMVEEVARCPVRW